MRPNRARSKRNLPATRAALIAAGIAALQAGAGASRARAEIPGMNDAVAPSSEEQPAEAPAASPQGDAVSPEAPPQQQQQQQDPQAFERPGPVVPPAEPEDAAEGSVAKHTRARRLKEVPWPGSFVAARVGFSSGQALIPKFGFGGDSTAVDTVGQFAPYLGTEFFYSGKHWGGGLTFEGSFLSLTPSSAWGGSPVSLMLGLEVSYIPNRKLRWIFGFEPFDSYRFAFPSGQNLTSRGVGLRAGIHFLLDEPTPRHAWEAYGYLSFSRFTQVAAGTNGQTQNYNPFDFTGVDSYTGTRLLMIGIQYNLAY